MTAKETERLARVEQRVADLKESTERGFHDLKKGLDDNNRELNMKLDKFIERADDTFITVAQAKVAAWFIGTVIGIVSVAVLVWAHLTKW